VHLLELSRLALPCRVGLYTSDPRVARKPSWDSAREKRGARLHPRVASGDERRRVTALRVEPLSPVSQLERMKEAAPGAMGSAFERSSSPSASSTDAKKTTSAP